jgi:hypothetical protein
MLKKKKGDAKPANRKACLDTAREEIFGGLSEGINMTLLANLVQPHGQPQPERSVGSARTVGAGRPGTHAVKRKRAFLRAFRDNCSVTESALLIGIDSSTHYDWLAADAKYKAAFEAAIPMAIGAVQDAIVRVALTGVFVPLIYKGKIQRAERERTICKLAEGTTAFEDELPKGARVTGRQIVTTRDGEILGIYRHHTCLLTMLLKAWMPERYGTGRQRRSDGLCDKDPAQPPGFAGNPGHGELMQAIERLHSTVSWADVMPHPDVSGLPAESGNEV